MNYCHLIEMCENEDHAKDFLLMFYTFSYYGIFMNSLFSVEIYAVQFQFCKLQVKF